jgi:catechol 2,3-dioxygenase-like lactoylglutathione lyase family enzyme
MHQSPSSITFVAPVLQVSDLARSVAYYRNQLGFQVEFEYEGFYASVLRDGCRVHLNCANPYERDQEAFEAAEHLDACFGVVNAEALASELAASGASISVNLRTMPYGREFYVRDPDGYILGFIQPTDMKEGAHAA